MTKLVRYDRGGHVFISVLCVGNYARKSPYLLSTTSYLILQRPGSSVHLVYVQEVLGSNPSLATSFQGHTILNMVAAMLFSDQS